MTMKSKKVIVVIEDDEDDRLFLREALRKVDTEIELIEVESAPDLFALLKSETTPLIDLFVIDLGLPAINGLEVFEDLRSTPGYTLARCVMLTNTIDQYLHLSAARIGLNEIYEKPSSILEYNQLALSLTKVYRESTNS